MHFSKSRLIALSLISLLLVSGCAGASAKESSSLSSSSPISSANSTGKSLTISLAKNTMTYGGDFISACEPHILYQNGAAETTLSISNSALSIKLVQGQTTYTPADLLPVGHYEVNLAYPFAKLTASTSFDVVSGNPISASEGQGYSTRANLSDYRLSQYPTLTALGEKSLDTLSKKKILVIPVTFKDNDPFTSDELSIINQAYNGAASDTGWQSLSSYYSTSSYGKFSLEATIATPFVFSQSDSEFEDTAKNLGNNYPNAVVSLAEAAIASLPSTFDLASYDGDGDSYLDGLELVYKTTRPNLRSGGSSVWWNFTSTDSHVSQSTTEKVGYYFWSEFSALTNGYYTPNIDTHVLIHEMGHILGLNDYYSYDRDEDPAGGADMMDHNIGDHGAYSKLLLGWANPKIIDGSASDFTLSLAPFEKSGDCILLRNTTILPFNGTPYDEYLLLSYYTPTSLNELDSKGYREWSGHGCYSASGLQVFHVDSRLYKKGSPQDSYVSSPSEGDGVAASNTASYSRIVEKSSAYSSTSYSPYRLLKALPATGENLFASKNSVSAMGTNSVLFGSDSTTGGNYYNNYKMRNLFPNGLSFDDGSTLNYSFSVLEQNAESLQLHFVKNA